MALAEVVQPVRHHPSHKVAPCVSPESVKLDHTAEVQLLCHSIQKAESQKKKKKKFDLDLLNIIIITHESQESCAL